MASNYQKIQEQFREERFKQLFALLNERKQIQP